MDFLVHWKRKQCFDLKFVILVNIFYLKLQETSFIIDIKMLSLQTSCDIFTASYDRS